MIPLKVAFLWHNHQPNYELNGELILPWVRFHCIKDYLNIPNLILKYPNIKQTFNFVPSLLDQIEQLANGIIIDNIMRYTYPNPEDLNPEDKKYIIDNFFICNYDNLIKPYDNYLNLFNKKNKDINNWNNQELLDLQVWYNLTWCGEDIKKNNFIQRLFKKGKIFTQEEKLYLLEIQLNYLKLFINNLKLINHSNQIELSFSPYYHPILPLVNNFESVKENMQEIDVNFEFKYPEDAKKHIKLSKNKYREIFDIDQKGMWSSEGSLSNDILNSLIENNIQWTASDEDLLKNTIGDIYNPLEIYFPRIYNGYKGKINICFRDHKLSDKIGFHYSGMDEKEAVNDLINNLLNIKNKLINIYDENILNKACVYIILDGENCWEFYKNNGELFLNLLFEELNKNSELKTVTMSESVLVDNIPFDKLNNIKAGSWIYGNFKIWAGESKNHLAWKLLSDTRKILEKNKNKIDNNTYESAYYYILRAEASDWFWWYYSEHHAPNKLDFDILFRNNLIKVYKILDEKIPNILNKSLWSEEELEQLKNEKNIVPSVMHQVE